MVPCSVDMKSLNIASCLACLLAFIKGSKCKLSLASSAVAMLSNVVLRLPIDWQEGGRAMGVDRRPASSILCLQWLRPALSVNARKREAGRSWSPADRWSFPETNLDMFFILEKKNRFICQAMVRKGHFCLFTKWYYKNRGCQGGYCHV